MAFEAWVRQVRQYVSRLDITSRQRESFRGEFTQCQLGALSLSTVAATQQDAEYSATPGNSSHCYDLVCMRRGEMVIEQDGRTLAAARGDVILVSKRTRFRFSTSDETECDLLACSRDWLRTWLPDPDACIMRPMSANLPWVNALHHLLLGVNRALAGNETFSSGLMADQLGGNIGLIFGSVPHEGTSYRRSLKRELLRSMRAQFNQPDLSPGMIAEQHRISLRYLHSIFASTGETFGTELRAIRLDRFRAMLRDPAFSCQTVSEISLRCGFRDPAYLSRVFREQCGRTPTEFRNAKEVEFTPVSGTC